MGKYLLLLILIGVSAVTLRAEEAVPDTGDRKGPNVINIAAGVPLYVEWNGSGVGLLWYGEYARNIRGNFWVGGALNVDYIAVAGYREGSYSYGNTMVTGYGLVYWEIPVARRWLSFRAGAGVGIGVHPASPSNYSIVASRFMVRAEWVVHFSENFGLTFAPLVAGPSQFEWMPGWIHPVPGSRGWRWRSDIFGHLGLYIRF